MKLELATIEILIGLQEQPRNVVNVVAKTVERIREKRHAKHTKECDCPLCQNNRKWEQRFEELYGAEMRAYYAPRQPEPGVSACGLEEASHFSLTPETSNSPRTLRNLLRPELCES